MWHKIELQLKFNLESNLFLDSLIFALNNSLDTQI